MDRQERQRVQRQDEEAQQSPLLWLMAWTINTTALAVITQFRRSWNVICIHERSTGSATRSTATRRSAPPLTSAIAGDGRGNQDGQPPLDLTGHPTQPIEQKAGGKGGDHHRRRGHQTRNESVFVNDVSRGRPNSGNERRGERTQEQ